MNQATKNNIKSATVNKRNFAGHYQKKRVGSWAIFDTPILVGFLVF